MYRLTYILTITVLISIQLFSQSRWIPLLQQTKTATSINLSSSNKNNVSFTIQINGITVVDRKVEGINYQQLSIPNGEVIVEEGSPQIPIVSKLIAIPDCDDISFSVIPSNPVEFNNYNILPVPKFEKKKWEDDIYTEVFIENKNIYSNNNFFPGKNGEIIETGYVRDQKVARVVVYPVQFNPVSKTITVYSDFTVNLSFINPSSQINKELGIFRNMMHNAALNYELGGISASSKWEDVENIIQKNNLNKSTPAKITTGSVTRITNLSTLIGAGALPCDYLIITHSTLFNSSYLTTLANHRRDYNGYDVVIVRANDDIYNFRPRAEEYISIRDFITDVYNDGTANHTGDGHLGYILLVGDAFLDNNSTEMLPAQYTYTGFAAAGDYYYACTGGDTDPYLDLMYGRLPVGNSTQLNNVVSKIISYEYNSNGSWCTDYTFVAGSYDLFPYADPDMEDLTEIVPPTYTKSYAYRALNTAGPSVVTEANPIFGQRFTQTEYQDPGNLCGSRLLNDWLYDDAIAGINNRIHTFIYEGHGSWRGLIGEGCGRQIFKVEDCISPHDNTVDNRLNNDLYSFMIFNCCEAGYFDNGPSDPGDCVAEVVTTLENRGAIGILASTRPSYVSAFGVVDGRVLDAMYNSLSHVMGEAIMESKLNISTLLFRRQYNLYGDPAVNLWPTGHELPEDITLSGTIDISSDITVASGTTLTILSGTTIKFSNNSSLIVYGTLNATNTTFTSTPAALTWDGIRFESNSGGTLDGCTIQEVDRSGGAITIINSDPTITDCTIENLWTQTDGIVILNCSTTKRPYLYNNSIEDGDDGVYLYNSTAYFRENDISSDYYALKLNGSMALFYAPNSTSVQGNNNIHDANYGLYLNNSVVMAGWGDGTGAHNNRFANDNYNAYAVNNSVAMARQNYWTPNPPSKIYSDATSSVDYSQYLLSKAGNGALSFLEDFYKAMKLHYYEKNYAQAYENLILILDKYRNTEGIEKVYTELARLYYDYPEEKVIDYLENEKEEKSTIGRAVILENMANIYSTKENETKQIEVIEEILTDYKNTIHEKNALLSKFYLYYMKGDYEMASKAIYSISDKYAEDKDIFIAKSLIEEYMGSDSEFKIEQTHSGDEVPDSFELLGNYPNPFNPMTTICFSIPQHLDVQLVVFDILGRKVVELVNKSLEAGKYEISFDGTSYSSGMYIYKLTAGSFTESKKMLLVK